MTRVLVVAGTASGVGKTSISLALARAYTRRGLKVRAAKVGPDYLDPMHLTLATGRPCINLDSYMMGRAYVLQLARRAASGMDLLIVEGVMGLFDGVDPTSNHGSTAEMAQLLDAGVLLVVDAHAMARSFAATVQGFCQFERGLSISAVVANRVGSSSHGELLGRALESAHLPHLTAAIPEGAFPKLASRHLGLVAPTDLRPLDALADAAERHFDLDGLLATSKPLMALSRPSEDPATKIPLRLAVARDEAFGFMYSDFEATTRRHGVEWIECSPLRDHCVPKEANALYLPGGYPELHARALAENRPFLDSLAAFAAKRPVYAECGGLMLLGETLVDGDGQEHRLSGVLPGRTVMSARSFRLGYAEVTLSDESLWGTHGDRCRGHEFHYSTLELDETRAQDWKRVYDVEYRRGTKDVEGLQRGNILASYVHLHLPSRPEQLVYFLKKLAA
jgi:cobyrinic acid a,c-diamide synthase